jgi:hypothetical protein
MTRGLLVVVVVLLASKTAHADRALHAGLDVRTDLGTHHTRLAVGYQACAWDTTLVLDPMVVLDGQHDLDLIAERYLGPRVALFAGLRWSVVAVDGGANHQERTVMGITGLGPTFWDGALVTKFSLELATLWVKHGGGAETDWISVDRNLIDHFSFGLFVRIEYRHAL